MVLRTPERPIPFHIVRARGTMTSPINQTSAQKTMANLHAEWSNAMKTARETTKKLKGENISEQWRSGGRSFGTVPHKISEGNASHSSTNAPVVLMNMPMGTSTFDVTPCCVHLSGFFSVRSMQGKRIKNSNASLLGHHLNTCFVFTGILA